MRGQISRKLTRSVILPCLCLWLLAEPVFVGLYAAEGEQQDRSTSSSSANRVGDYKPSHKSVDAGVQLYMDGSFQEAITALEEVCEAKRPQDNLYRARLFLSLSYCAMQDTVLAKRNFKAAIVADPEKELLEQDYSPTVRRYYQECREVLPIPSDVRFEPEAFNPYLDVPVLKFRSSASGVTRIWLVNSTGYAVWEGMQSIERGETVTVRLLAANLGLGNTPVPASGTYSLQLLAVGRDGDTVSTRATCSLSLQTPTAWKLRAQVTSLPGKSFEPDQRTVTKRKPLLLLLSVSYLSIGGVSFANASGNETSGMIALGCICGFFGTLFGWAYITAVKKSTVTDQKTRQRNQMLQASIDEENRRINEESRKFRENTLATITIDSMSITLGLVK